MKKLIAIMVLAVIALANAIYLTRAAYEIDSAPKDQLTMSRPCDINNVFSCSKVLSTPYSKVFGLPFPAIAIAVYPIIFLIALLGFIGVIKKPFPVLALLGIGGMCFNGFFISREFLYVGAYCPLCMVCSGIITTIFVLSIV